MQIIGETTKEPCIYKITSPSGRIYIGQTKNFRVRYLQYIKVIRAKNQVLLYRSFLKHGVNNHTVEIIEITTIDLLNEREIYWIDYYKSNKSKYPNLIGLNLCDGGNTVRGIKRTQEHKDKISKANKGRKMDNAFRERCRENAKGNKHNLGKTKSPQTKQKISETKKGQASGGKNPSAKKVIDTKTLIIYSCAKEAAKLNGLSEVTMYRYLQGTYPNKTNLIYLSDYTK